MSIPEKTLTIARGEVAAGCDPDVIRGRVDDVLAPGEKL